VVHTLDMKAMKVAMDLEKEACVLCPTHKSLFATIVNRDTKAPVELEEVKRAFLGDPNNFYLKYEPQKTLIGNHVGLKALEGVTPQTVVLCIMHSEIRIYTNETKQFLKKVSISSTTSQSNSNSNNIPLSIGGSLSKCLSSPVNLSGLHQ